MDNVLSRAYVQYTCIVYEVANEVGAPHTSLDDHSLTFPWAAFVKASISTDWSLIHLLYTTSSNYGHKYIHKFRYIILCIYIRTCMNEH